MTTNLSGWKAVLLKGIGFGAGFALTLSLIVGLWFWRESKPRPPKSWNTAALVVAEPPGFYVSEDGKTLELRYYAKNNTDSDYGLDDEAAKKLRGMAKFRDGTLSAPMENRGMALRDTPIFIPFKQTGQLNLSIKFSNLPTRAKSESDSDFHERLRTYLKMEYADLSEFVLFDEANRYQINLPTWAEKKPTN